MLINFHFATVIFSVVDKRHLVIFGNPGSIPTRSLLTFITVKLIT